ncbi:hypothetical protein ABIC12_002862 [Pantoea agglomerans]|jgi:hypothetical protein|uniref:relaxosome protein TraM n=1 Tax=Enterobacter agglomerans TaxID=549 RepID=UPI0013B77F9C|nr:relaxosome protein TraM [Pantoea agglomerans]MDQ0431159.1 hypothetical protein [Pantoea agglomerans]NEG84649.1 hypothetical protein [Pantoea agglomerans]NEH06790.1 hypothetical protein [Pantoea agglomerans]
MPRAQIYITKANLEKIRSIVNLERNHGVDENEANLSSVAAMLLNLGLQVYEFQQRKKQNGENDQPENDDAKKVAMFNRILMENVLKTSYASAAILQMVGELDELKNKNSYGFHDLKSMIRRKTENKLSEIFDEE